MSPEYYEAVFAALVKWGVAAIFLERSLYQLFDTKTWKLIHNRVEERYYVDLKPIISFLVCVYVCFLFQYDIFAVAFVRDGSWATITLTAGALAGGSTGFFKALARIRKVKDAEAVARINGHGNGS